MNNRFFRLPAGLTNQARNAFIVISAYLFGSIVAGSYFVLQAIQAPSWQAWTVGLSLLAIVVSGTIALILVRRGRPESGIWLTIGASYVTATGIVIAVSGMGALLLVSSVFLTSMVAIQTLQSRQGLMVMSGMAMGIVFLLTDLFLTTERMFSFPTA